MVRALSRIAPNVRIRQTVFQFVELEVASQIYKNYQVFKLKHSNHINMLSCKSEGLECLRTPADTISIPPLNSHQSLRDIIYLPGERDL